MTDVPDPIRVDPDCENVVVGGALVPDGFGDHIYDVDDEGYARDDAGNRVHFATRILATDVEPETWRDHYHHPLDCPEKDLPILNPMRPRSTCDDCTIGVKREHGFDYYAPERDNDEDFDMEAFTKRVEDAVAELRSNGHRPVEPAHYVSEEMQSALQDEVR